MRFLVFKDVNNSIINSLEKFNLVDYSYEIENFLEKFYLYDYDLILLNIYKLEKKHLDAIEEISHENNKIPILYFMEKIDFSLIEKILKIGIKNLLFGSNYFNCIQNIQTIGSLSFNHDSNCFYTSDKELILSKKEFFLLKFLFCNSNHFVSKNKIVNRLINDVYEKNSNLIEVYIYRLRKILKENKTNVKIISKRNFGYKISAC